MSVAIVAELSGNHMRSEKRALDLIDAAKEAGADAVKLQTFDPEQLAVDNPDYTTLTDGPWAGRTLLDLYRETALPWEWHERLFRHAESQGLVCFSSPFHPSAVALLEGLGCPIYKVASFEVGDEPLLQAIAATRKPVVLSTGVAEGPDIDRALARLGTASVTLLHCVSEYPANPWEMNLGRIHALKRYRCSVGLSDHSLTPTAAVCATALGATMIEKHLCLRRSDGGPDSAFSLEPKEFQAMVGMVRDAEKATVPRAAKPHPSPYRWLKKSLWVVKNVRFGDEITAENVRSLRPGHGMDPGEMVAVMGQSFAVDVQAGTPLTEGLLAPRYLRLEGRALGELKPIPTSPA